MKRAAFRAYYYLLPLTRICLANAAAFVPGVFHGGSVGPAEQQQQPQHSSLSNRQRRQQHDNNVNIYQTTTTNRRRRLSPGRIFGSSSSDKDESLLDFSSTRYWEQFYQRQPRDESFVEWHSKVPNQALVDLIPPPPLSSNGHDDNNHSILIIGCGTSRLPELIQARYPQSNLILLDSSPTCMDILQARYHDNDRITCLVGNVLNMNNLVVASSTSSGGVDCIYDKGLLDALLCGEGWNGPVAQLLHQAAEVLARRPGSSYVLVSYPLPTSTQDYIRAQHPDLLEWTFGLQEHGKVQLSRAVVKK